MKKFLSVLLAVMMILSTVSFAAPFAATGVETVDGSIVFAEESMDTDTEAFLYAGDEWEHSEYGIKIFVADFETKNDGTAVISTDVSAITNSRADSAPATGGIAATSAARVNPAYASIARLNVKGGAGATIAGTADNQYLKVTSAGDSLILSQLYVGDGTYVIEFDTNSASFSEVRGSYNPGILPTSEAVDGTWTRHTHVVENVTEASSKTCSSYQTDNIRFLFSAKPTMFDNIVVYYKPEGWTPGSGASETSNTWYDKTKGTLLFNMDFDKNNDGNAVSASAYDAISLGSYPSAGAGELVSGLGRLNPEVDGNYDIGFRYTTAGSATLGEEDGNKYLSVNSSASNQISLYLGNVYTKPGKYVFEYSYKLVTTGTTTASSISYNTLIPTEGSGDNFVADTWVTETATFEVTSKPAYSRVMFNGSANFLASDKLYLDDIKVWYYDTDLGADGYAQKVLDRYVTVVSGKSDVPGITIPVPSGTTVTMQQVMAIVGAEFADCAGFAETELGEILPLDTVITISEDMTFYAVWGVDVSVSANGNGKVSDVTAENVDSRYGITVGELMAKIDLSSSERELLGLSYTAGGEILSKDTVVNDNATLYMIWGAESLANKWYDEELGTRLFFMDFESNNSGAAITESDFAGIGNQSLYSNALTDSIGAYIKKLGRMNPCIGPEYDNMFKIGFRNAPASTVIAGDDSNKYMVANISSAMSLITNHHFVGNGVYTIIFDYKNDCGTTFNFHSGYSGGTASTEDVDSTWKRLTYQANASATNYFRFISASAPANGSFTFDNIALYFKPTGKLSLTVAGSANNVYSVDAGTYTASELVELVKADIPTCVGFSRSSGGDVISGDETIDIAVNTTLYAVAGFDVTLKAGDNADFSDVTLTGFDSKNGVTVRELLSGIENNTDRLIKGLSETAGGTLLPKDTVIREAKTLYINWTVDESTLGTLIFNINFEKDGIEAPSAAVDVNAVTDIYNSDLVPAGIKFHPDPTRLNSFSLETVDGNTYFVANTISDSRAKYNINEFANGFAWTNGTYTLVADVKTDAAAVLNSDRITAFDGFYNDAGQWNRISGTLNGAVSSAVNESGEPYGTINFCIQAPAGTALAIDNVKLYFKTDVTTVTVKNGGNDDVTDTVVSVSTTEGITVADLIAEVEKQETSRTLLGISTTPTGELLSLDEVIVPKYPVYYYAIWHSKSNNPYIDDNLGHMLFNIDFENQDVIDADWNGYAELDNTTNKTAGARIIDVASYYNEILEGKNVRAFFRIDPNVTADNKTVSVKADSEGNHYLEGISAHSNPKAQIINNAGLVLEDGIYTMYVDALSTGASLASYNYHGANVKLVEGDKNGDGKWDFEAGSWKTYGLSYEFTGGAAFTNTQIQFNDSVAGSTVAYDNFKLYYKPFKATITLEPGTYPEFGTRTVEGISTTGENTGNDIIAALESEFASCGVNVAGLMDEYGEMLDLSKPLVIPGDVTYTIIWGDEQLYAPLTQQSNSIRPSKFETLRGLRFGAMTMAVNTEEASEYGWIITREKLLNDAGIGVTSFTKNSPVKKVIGLNYHETEQTYRKHYVSDGNQIMLTAVIYGVKEENYKEVFVARPYMVVDGVTYYGKAWKRSFYDTAVALKNNGYDGFEQQLIDYIEAIIAAGEKIA